VFLSLPGSIFDDETDLNLGHRTRVRAHGTPADNDLDDVVEAIIQSRSPVIIAGRELAEQGAFEEAQAFAEILGAPVYHEPIPYNTRYPVRHRAFMGDLTRNQQKVRETLGQHDVMMVLGGDLLRMSAYSETDPMPDHLRVIHISEREWELGKNYPTEFAIRGGVKAVLNAILPRVDAGLTIKQRADAQQRLELMSKSNWAARKAQSLRSLSLSTNMPISPGFLARAIAECVPKDAIVVEEAPTLAPLLGAVLEVDEPRNFFGLASGGLGFAMGGAVGAALARPGSPIVAVVGDGSAMYAIQALWTAAHLDLPITYVIANNRSYRIIKERLVAMRGTDRFLGMDFTKPRLNFVSMANGMGVMARKIDDPSNLAEALRHAIASGRPCLIDVVIDPGVQKA
jgi:benzoylformate decarboxylase